MAEHRHTKERDEAWRLLHRYDAQHYKVTHTQQPTPPSSQSGLQSSRPALHIEETPEETRPDPRRRIQQPTASPSTQQTPPEQRPQSTSSPFQVSAQTFGHTKQSLSQHPGWPHPDQRQQLNQASQQQFTVPQMGKHAKSTLERDPTSMLQPPFRRYDDDRRSPAPHWTPPINVRNPQPDQLQQPVPQRQQKSAVLQTSFDAISNQERSTGSMISPPIVRYDEYARPLRAAGKQTHDLSSGDPHPDSRRNDVTSLPSTTTTPTPTSTTTHLRRALATEPQAPPRYTEFEALRASPSPFWGDQPRVPGAFHDGPARDVNALLATATGKPASEMATTENDGLRMSGRAKEEGEEEEQELKEDKEDGGEKGDRGEVDSGQPREQPNQHQHQKQQPQPTKATKGKGKEKMHTNATLPTPQQQQQQQQQQQPRQEPNDSGLRKGSLAILRDFGRAFSGQEE
ncbi:hypothetical protein AC578_10033 [Pseudocercospora eumusae]|uniref:Uncharacterized protein n=1 Tax=Pseudocercospora eumusae TaxID=321146 RepID=A0A139H6J4_9PEZI|nr:hypothetical protein AC578_10033 [Pseudocercospora eumusae]